MRPPSEKTVWADYAGATSYSGDEATAKRGFVQDMAQAVKPALLFDLGCNTGDYSEAALDAGAASVVGFDFDHATLDRAFDRFDRSKRPFLPLWMDAANPSPSQGWAQAERAGLQQRARADALIALAFIHHIVIGRNVPLDMAVDWITGLAPIGVIEFPPKSDPMVQRLLALRADIFPDYTVETFLAVVGVRAQVVRTKRVSENGRLLVWYERPRRDTA
jgi:ribosomal protein L11 methylase PrmA